MKLKSWLIAGALAIAPGAGAANASPITYVGDYGPTLQFTITTDGTMGDINGHVTSFNIESSVFPDGGFNSSNGTVIFEDSSFEATGPSIIATSKGLSYDFDYDLYDIVFLGETNPDPDDVFLIQSGGGFVPGNGLYVASSSSEDDGTLITETGTQIIATPLTSAAPEPGVWSLMICGLALVGGALRRVRPVAPMSARA